MTRVKVNYGTDQKEVKYDKEQWQIFRLKRSHARKICEPFHERGIPLLVYGSIARGDVHRESDLDIIIPTKIPSFQVEITLDTGGLQIIGKEIVQATPGDAIKGHIYLSDDTTITLFLSTTTDLSYEFYNFAGSVSYQDIRDHIRKPGVDKSLTLILPTKEGHKEYSVLLNEKFVIDTLGISQRMIDVRKRVLKRRDKVGRTGVFLKEPIDIESSFEEELKKISDANPAVKRKMYQ